MAPLWPMLIPAGIEMADRIGLMDAIGLGGGREYTPQESRNMQTQADYNQLSMDIAKDRYGRERQYVPSATDAIFEYANRMSNQQRPMLWGRGIFEPKFGARGGQSVQPGQGGAFQPSATPDLEPTQSSRTRAPVTFDRDMPGRYGEYVVDAEGRTSLKPDDASDLYGQGYDPSGSTGMAVTPEGDVYARTSDSRNPWAWAQAASNDAGAGADGMSDYITDQIAMGGGVKDANGNNMIPGDSAFDSWDSQIPKEVDYGNGFYTGGTDPNDMIDAPPEIKASAISVSDPSISEDLLRVTSMDRETQLAETGEFGELVPVGGDYFIMRFTDAQGNVIREVAVAKDDTASSYEYDGQITGGYGSEAFDYSGINYGQPNLGDTVHGDPMNVVHDQHGMAEYDEFGNPIGEVG